MNTEITTSANLPPGWTVTSVQAQGWLADTLLPNDKLALRDGLNWVALGTTGIVTMQGKPITHEHFQALGHLMGLVVSGR